MATARKRSAPAKRSTRIAAKPTPDAEFLALLRKQCLSAASVGALTAAGELIPGLSRVLGLVFGELLDAKVLANIQRHLIEKTFAIYGLELPKPVHEVLVGRVQMIGTSASVAGDALVRVLLKRTVGQFGTFVAARVVPLTSIASSAFANAMVTYAVGKRAQAVAKLRDAPITGMPDAVRAFSGVDERRVLDWTVEAMKSSFALVSDTLGRLVTRKPAAKKNKKKRRAAAG
jgi:uncharacterized protein (DUF697 family)